MIHEIKITLIVSRIDNYFLEKMNNHNGLT